MRTKIPSSLKAMYKLAMLVLLMVIFSCSQETVLDPAQNSAENLKAQAAKSEKGKRVTKKISARVFNFPDPDQTSDNFVFCLPGDPDAEPEPIPPSFPLSRNIINGQMTHLGKLQPGTEYDESENIPIIGSYGVPVSCYPGAEDLSKAITVYDVYYVAANGDRFVTIEHVTLNFNFVDCPDFSCGTFTNTLKTEEDENMEPDPFPGVEVGDPIPISVVSGTGRFEGATGKLYFKDATFGPEGTTWELVGEITY